MISVIVPAYNAEKTIGECLSSLMNQSYPKKSYEIIVVDDGSTDNTKNMVKKLKKVKLVEQKHGGPAAARNLGVKHAKGKIILFTDSDCVLGKDWIKYMTKSFKNKEIAGVSGTYRTLNKDKLIARFAGYEIEERHIKLANEENIDFIGTFSAGYRKNVLEKAGGFNTVFSAANAEDTDFSFRLSEKGHRMVLAPKAYVYHKHPGTLWKYLKQKYSRGYWRVLLYKKHTKKVFKHSYTPKTIYLKIVLTGTTLLSLLLTIMGIVPHILTVSFVLLTFASTLPLSARIFKKDRTVGLISPFILILRNTAIGLGILRGMPLLLFKR